MGNRYRHILQLRLCKTFQLRIKMATSKIGKLPQRIKDLD